MYSIISLYSSSARPLSGQQRTNISTSWEKGYADLKDILLLFIYLELGAMIGIYFKTHRLPVQFLVFIAITALSRHLVIDVQKVSEDFHLYLLLAISGAVVLLSVALLLLTFTERQYGRPEDDIHKEPQKKD